MNLHAFARRVIRWTYLASAFAVRIMLAQGSGYWHTSGSRILDADNQQVRIAGINWYGFETQSALPGGLATQDYKSILQTIKNQGYNTVRIPFSNQMVEAPPAKLNITFSRGTTPVNDELHGLDSLRVLDKIVDAAEGIGLKIILDNHRSTAGDGPESNGLWYTRAYPEAAWIRDWTGLATRYLGKSAVIGFDLRNEPHSVAAGGACWDCGGARDWHLAAARAGNAVLAVNPHLLIFVEGTDTYNSDAYWWGGNLQGVERSPVVLSVPNQLVYSAHDYGPHEHVQRWFNSKTSSASLNDIWTRHWAFISQRGLAPVWLGEFGTTNRDTDLQSMTPGSQGQWFDALVNFLQSQRDISWTYWAVNGEDSYSLLDGDYSAVSALKQSALAAIQFPLNSAGTGSPVVMSAAPNSPTSLLPLKLERRPAPQAGRGADAAASAFPGSRRQE